MSDHVITCPAYVDGPVGPGIHLRIHALTIRMGTVFQKQGCIVNLNKCVHNSHSFQILDENSQLYYTHFYKYTLLCLRY